MLSFDYKQVVVVRIDLEMSDGKTAVQVAHAAVSGAEMARKERYTWWRSWLEEGQRKIAVTVDSEEKLLEIEEEARKMKLPTALVQDRGLTEVPPGTYTCLGIGPAPSQLVDKVTGSLPLL